jgi:hypothetical protein
VDGLEGILVGLAARYPSLLNTTLMVHLFCVAIVIGTVVAFDLRLLGFWRWLPARCSTPFMQTRWSATASSFSRCWRCLALPSMP